ncbi:hypothetical protein MMSR116_00805 [Methylobacterium mesophilicum SR1.6/6]|uniref:Uncharacterized protein n=1 Tax=Methylobacterium mesophilicum SR1.6/6 TaxID=908290 RepID=A0A6B9FB05_9HYPH|nr:hypothetical protein [Methylobacterium mesophilicum]QGY00607.1 hypothetical protein MMSR116_00805 [Methylobacterium mesophilicum SR1.6/6]
MADGFSTKNSVRPELGDYMSLPAVRASAGSDMLTLCSKMHLRAIALNVRSCDALTLSPKIRAHNALTGIASHRRGM